MKNCHWISVRYSVLEADVQDIGQYSNLAVLNGMTQIQMFLASAGK